MGCPQNCQNSRIEASRFCSHVAVLNDVDYANPVNFGNLIQSTENLEAIYRILALRSDF